MKNIRDMEQGLTEMFDLVMKDPKRCCQAKEVANVAGKLIAAQKISMEYASMHKREVELPFMER